MCGMCVVYVLWVCIMGIVCLLCMCCACVCCVCVSYVLCLCCTGCVYVYVSSVWVICMHVLCTVWVAVHAHVCVVPRGSRSRFSKPGSRSGRQVDPERGDAIWVWPGGPTAAQEAAHSNGRSPRGPATPGQVGARTATLMG